MNDWELIQKYCNGSESAFEALVKRDVNYVYCAALRQVTAPSSVQRFPPAAPTSRVRL